MSIVGYYFFFEIGEIMSTFVKHFLATLIWFNHK